VGKVEIDFQTDSLLQNEWMKHVDIDFHGLSHTKCMGELDTDFRTDQGGVGGTDNVDTLIDPRTVRYSLYMHMVCLTGKGECS